MKQLVLLFILICNITFAQDGDSDQRRTSPSPPPVAKTTGSLSGQFTIGGTNPDYATFGAAFADLMTQGVSGPCEFFVRSGTYNEQLSLGAVPGSSSANPIIFHSEVIDSSAVTIVYAASGTAANNFTLQLNGTDYVSFTHMTFERSGAGTFSTVVELANDCDNVVFSNNVFKGPSGQTATNTTGSQSGIFSDDLFSNDFVEILRNRFQDNSNGVWLNGSSTAAKATGLDITGNIFNNFYVGVFVLYHEAPIVHENTINRNNPSSTIDYYGISMRYIDGGLLIVKNKVSTYTGSYGIRVRESDGGITGGIIANNFVQIGDPATGRGISLEDGCISQGIVHNTVNYSALSTSGRALNVEGTGTSSIYIINNALIHHGSGISAYIASAATSGISMSNYNCFYTAGLVFGFWGTNVSSLAAWQIASSNKDVNSISTSVTFVSNYDLHVNSTALDGAGTPAGIADDIDGEARNITAPDIGADEFTFSSINETAQLQAHIFPNPFADVTVIMLDEENSNAYYSSKVYDLTGRIVKSELFTGSTYVFSREQLKAGVYLLEIISSDDETKYTNRIVAD